MQKAESQERARARVNTCERADRVLRWAEGVLWGVALVAGGVAAYFIAAVLR